MNAIEITINSAQIDIPTFKVIQNLWILVIICLNALSIE